LTQKFVASALIFRYTVSGTGEDAGAVSNADAGSYSDAGAGRHRHRQLVNIFYIVVVCS